MKVVHLDLPRAFTMTVKEYLVDVEGALTGDGVEFSQYDTNPVYWRWLLDGLDEDDGRSLFDALRRGVATSDPWQQLETAQAHFQSIEDRYGVRLGLRGLDLSPEVRVATAAMCGVLADGYGEHFFDAFFTELDRRYHILDAEVLSLGLTYPEGVFWALALAAWIKARNSEAHVVISRHAYGNFSLVHQVDALMRTKLFFLLIDSVVLYQEDLPETMLGLVSSLRGEPSVTCHNMVTSVGGSLEKLDLVPQAESMRRETHVNYGVPAEYFESMEVDSGDLVYSMDLVRNKCFYKQCNFCTQIHHHVGDQAFNHGDEIERALNAMEQLAGCGVNLVNFQDEAMNPRDLKVFCEGVIERGLSPSWVGRMITVSVADPSVLQLMRRAGCVEMLFGVETFDPDHARDLGKVSGRYDSADEIGTVIKSFLDAGLFVILSMIVDFPTEKQAVRETNLRSLKEILAYSDHVGMYINHYELFKPSVVYDRPKQFGIEIEAAAAGDDLRYNYEYVAETGGMGLGESEEFDAIRFGLDVKEWRRVQQSVGLQAIEDLYFFDYNSWGLVHRIKTGETLTKRPITGILGDALV